MTETSSNSNVTISTEQLNHIEKRLNLLIYEISGINKELLDLRNVQVNNGNATNAATPIKRGLSETASTSSCNAKQVCCEFTMEDDHVVVFIDGACENNGRFGIGVWFGNNHPLNISKPAKGIVTDYTTCVIHACVKAVEVAIRSGIRKLKIKSNSDFFITSMTKWIIRWRTNDWKNFHGNDLKNQNDFIILDNLIKGMEHVDWECVEGQAGTNEVNKLAQAGAKQI